ncbi:MAG: hypothetical protein KJO65_10715 [Gemmatimonadetes bacterium]|nr:hypothetical protein [Gemmatimonadota bacterium]
MMGRTPDARTFPAVLLAFASLSTPALGAMTGETDAAPAGAVETGAEATMVNGASSTMRDPSGEESVLSTALALLAPTEDVVRRESSGPLAIEVGEVLKIPNDPGEAAAVTGAASDHEPTLATGPVEETTAVDAMEQDEVALWTTADTVTLDSQLLQRLRGDFVARLERVAERMWNEHGLRVEVVEGYRTPQRQQALFAQGRTTDGPVVTWTRNSLHSEGAAADLFVNGSTVTPEEAVLLARVAREEGLRTLHPFDSGHIQMEGVVRRGAPESALPRELSSPPAGPPQPKGVAPVAPVATPARPARPGGLVLEDLSAALEAAAPRTSAAPEEVVASARTQSPAEVVRALLASQDGSSASTQRHGLRAGAAAERSMRGHGESVRDEVGAKASVEAATKDTPAGRSPATSDIEPGLSALQPDKVDTGRAGARGGAAARPIVPTLEPSAHMARFESANGAVYRRLHVPIDGLGGPASLHLGVRGGTVDAALTLSDPLLASDLRENLHELRQSLASRGVDTGAIAIRVAPEGVRAASSTVELMSATASEVGGTNSASETRSGDSKHQNSRNGQPQFTDEHDDGPSSRRRGDKPRRNAQEK